MQAVAEKPTREEPAQGKSHSTDPEHIIAHVEHTTAGESQQLQATVDKDEWAAFERDMAAFPPEPSGRSALDAIKSGGTISAAPMTADEIAVQAQEKMRRSRREEEIADEKEDAAQALEEEFDEMEELEQRAKRLREMREKLREQQAVGNPDQQEHPEAQQDQDEEDDEGNVEEDIDDWIKFG
jgi:hypothetical protein